MHMQAGEGRVPIRASTAFHRVSNRPMNLVSVFPFGISTSIFHPNSWVISPVRHMWCTRSTRRIHFSLHGGVFDCYLGYASHHHCLKCSARRWVCPPALCGRRCHTAASTYASDEILSFTISDSTCVSRGIPGGGVSSIWYRVWNSPLTFYMSVQEGLGTRAESCQYQRFSMAYAPQGSDPPMEGARHAPISAVASSARLR